MSQFPESRLEIKKWLNKGELVLVGCTRCDNQVEVSPEILLEGLQCPRCDGKIEEECTCAEITPIAEPITMKLVPAILNMPGGVPLLVYIPMLEDK